MKQWETWMREWTYCPICSRSWFSEVGEEPQCTCEVKE